MDYTKPVQFEWDEIKSTICFNERGFDFEYVAAAFFDPFRIVREDNRYRYGEPRYQLLAKLEGRVYACAFTPRNNGIRIISARKANAREVAQYENGTFDG